MTADRARAHENYGIAAKPTIEERLAALERRVDGVDVWISLEEHGAEYRRKQDLADTPKPLPCPFCGSEPMVRGENQYQLAWVACENTECPTNDISGDRLLTVTVSLPGEAAEERKRLAIERWNKRA